MKSKNAFWNMVTLVALVAGLGGMWLAGATLVGPEEPVERAYQTLCYRTDGGDKWVCASGGEIEIQSGATLDIQAGATTDFSGGMDLDGGLLDLDADGDTSLQADTDDQIDVEISGADDFKFTANTFTVLAGSSLVNNGALDQNNNIDLDGAADEVHLAITGYTTQTNHLMLLEQSGGTDLFWVTNNGDVEMNGTTPLLTVGDAGEEDTQVTFDGAAQDFYACLDDTADDLVVGLGGACGTTPAFAIDENQVTTWSGGTIALAATTTAVDTLTASECGKTIFLNSATEYSTTLPAVSTVAAGCEFQFIVKAAPASADYTVITGNNTEDVMIGGINELEVDTNDDGPYDASADTITFVDGTAVVGDYVYMISDGTSWYVRGQANADGGVTITDSD